jgi:acyl-homoserine lactone acylase PvdQ
MGYNPGRLQPDEANGGWTDVQVTPGEIKVKGEVKPVKWAARATRHGPLIAEVIDERVPALALRWTSLDPGCTGNERSS